MFAVSSPFSPIPDIWDEHKSNTMNAKISEVMKCSRPGCDFKTSSSRGMENHAKSCDRKRSRSALGFQRRSQLSEMVPKRFGGIASHVPCDNIKATPTCQMTENHVPKNNQRENLEINSTGLPGLPIVGSNIEETRSLEAHRRKEKAEEMAAMLAYISRKVSKKASTGLMQILKDESFDKQLFNEMFKRSSDCIRFVDSLFDQELKHQGFEKLRLTNSDGDISCMLFLRNPVNLLREQIGLVDHQALSLHPRTEVDRCGRRSFGHPLSAQLGEEAIPSVIEYIKNSTNRKIMWNTSTENASFVALGQIYSDKTQTSLRANALTLYPVHLTLLNFREEDRRSFIISGRSVVGLLPTEYESTGTRSLTREMKMEMLQKSISKTFEALINVAMEGFSCQTADGITLKCHFALANYVCDLPEAWDVLGVKGQNSAFPCHRCTVPRDLLSIPSCYELRSVQETKECRVAARTARTKANQLECLNKYSLSLHASFLEKFPFVQCSPYLDIYSIFTFEPLHNIYLGLSKLLKEMCCQRLCDDTFSTVMQDADGRYKRFPEIRTALLNGMNHILSCIQRDSPATAFKIDFSDAGKSGSYNGFFVKDGLRGMLEAKDHRAVDQVMPFLAMFLDRFCGEVVSTSIFTEYAEITMLMFRRNMDPGYNAREIGELQQRINRFKEKVKDAYGRYQSSEMGTPKFHMLDHVCYDIKRMGGLQFGDSSYFERAHVGLKERFCESSRRKSSTMDEVVSNFHRNIVTIQGEKPKGNVVSKKGARYATFQDDVGSLVRGTHWFTVAQLHCTYLYRRSEWKGDKPSGVICTDADQLVQDIGFTATRMFLEVLEEKYKRMNLPQMSLSKVSSAFVTGGFMPSAQDVVVVESNSYGIAYRSHRRRVSQRVVSSSNFYGTGARHDCVLIDSDQMIEKRGKNVNIVWVGKVLGLFHTRLDGENEAIAFVRYFDVIPVNDDVTSILGCVNLKWAREGSTNEWFDIVPLASLTGVVPVLTIDYKIRGLTPEKPDHDKIFHINRFFAASAEMVY